MLWKQIFVICFTMQYKISNYISFFFKNLVPWINKFVRSKVSYNSPKINIISYIPADFPFCRIFQVLSSSSPNKSLMPKNLKTNSSILLSSSLTQFSVGIRPFLAFYDLPCSSMNFYDLRWLYSLIINSLHGWVQFNFLWDSRIYTYRNMYSI